MLEALLISMHGGYFVDEAQYAGIYFICDRDHANVRSFPRILITHLRRYSLRPSLNTFIRMTVPTTLRGGALIHVHPKELFQFHLITSRILPRHLSPNTLIGVTGLLY